MLNLFNKTSNNSADQLLAQIRKLVINFDEAYFDGYYRAITDNTEISPQNLEARLECEANGHWFLNQTNLSLDDKAHEAYLNTWAYNKALSIMRNSLDNYNPKLKQFILENKSELEANLLSYKPIKKEFRLKVIDSFPELAGLDLDAEKKNLQLKVLEARAMSTKDLAPLHPSSDPIYKADGSLQPKWR